MKENMSQMKKTNNNVIAVVGATASGKTAYAIDLAKRIDGEIISADSRLVYKDMNIGTAKPTLDEMSGIPHYMIDLVEPTFDFSAGIYSKQAKEIIRDIISRGKTPIMVGGTGLYFNIVLNNYDLPEIEPNYELRKELSEMPFEQLFDVLQELDPDAVNKIEQNDKKRIIRYIEVVKGTGLPLDKARGVSENEYNVEWIGLNFPREILYDRINKRVDLMIENGLVEETKNLISKYGHVPNITDTIGYREMIWALDGVMTFDEAVEKLKQNSRNYAKRQLTWFRKNPNIKWNCYPEKKKK